MKCRCYPYVLSVLPFKGSLILQNIIRRKGFNRRNQVMVARCISDFETNKQTKGRQRRPASWHPLLRSLIIQLGTLSRACGRQRSLPALGVVRRLLLCLSPFPSPGHFTSLASRTRFSIRIRLSSR
jgi:hypothetical protein